jgi:hypothetical protein
MGWRWAAVDDLVAYDLPQTKINSEPVQCHRRHGMVIIQRSGRPRAKGKRDQRRVTRDGGDGDWRTYRINLRGDVDDSKEKALRSK